MIIREDLTVLWKHKLIKQVSEHAYMFDQPVAAAVLHDFYLETDDRRAFGDAANAIHENQGCPWPRHRGGWS